MRLGAIAALAVGLSGAPVLAKDLATVNGKAITDKDFKEEVEQLGPQAEMLKSQPEARVGFINQLITLRLLEDAGRKKGIEKSDEFKNRMSMVERQVIASLYLENVVEDKTGDKELEKYFTTNKGEFSDKEVCAAHILLKEEEKAKAEELLKKVQAKDADFAALAKENSTGPSAPQGGDLGCFAKGRMVPEFEAAAFETKPNTVHPNLVKTRFGYHIIKVNSIKGGDEVKFADVKDRVEQEMRQKVRDELLENIRKEAKISVNETEVKALEF